MVRALVEVGLGYREFAGSAARDSPIVTTPLKSPEATRSISSSICCSEEDGELSRAYEEWGSGGAEGPAAALAVEFVAAFTGGRMEKREGEGAMNERYWSKT